MNAPKKLLTHFAVPTRAGVTRAVVLSGGKGATLFPLCLDLPKALIPVSNVPLLESLVDDLVEEGITRVAVSLDKDSRRHVGAIDKLSRKMNGRKVELRAFFEDNPRGTAGCIKGVESFLGGEPFAVVATNMLPNRSILAQTLAAHGRGNAVATVAAHHLNGRAAPRIIENIETEKNGEIKRISIIHKSVDKRKERKAVGLYVFGPEVLECIPETGYFDIKEQLLPRLKEKGHTLQTVDVDEAPHYLDSLSDYFLLNGIALSRPPRREGLVRMSDDVWAGRSVRISPKANLLGPIVIGDDCRIEDYAQIVGPVSLGDRVHVGADAVVRESIVWSDVHLEEKSVVQRTLIGDRSIIGKGETARNAVVMGVRKHNGTAVKVPEGYGPLSARPGYAPRSLRLRRALYLGAKRVVDVLLSACALVILSPLLLLIAIAVKLDSPGPAVFRQVRCGKGGKTFPMYKFRTMRADAENVKAGLMARNQVDGPMFKIESDPRITRVGGFLRSSSLDELPQLMNVLKGQMSLVGPRPLIMEEMKFSPAWRDLRLKVKPGITGLWQAYGRGVDFHDWISYDTTYVKEQSMMLDLKIVLQTIRKVIRRDKAY